VLQRLVDPVRHVWPARDHAHAERAVPIGELVRVACEAGEKRQRDEIRRGVDGNRADLLVDQLHVVLARRERRQVHARHRRNEVPRVTAAVARHVADDDADPHPLLR
jgi:gluconate kinase